MIGSIPELKRGEEKREGFVLVACLVLLSLVVLSLGAVTVRASLCMRSVRDYSRGARARMGAVSAAYRAFQAIDRGEDDGLGVFTPVRSDVEEGFCLVYDENGKFSLNALWDEKGDVRADRKREFTGLIRGLDGTEGDVKVLLEWVRNARLRGKRGNISSISELLNIPGWNLPRESTRRHLSVRRTEKLNLNSVTREVMESLFGRSSSVEALLKERQNQPFRSWRDLEERLKEASAGFREMGSRFTFRSDLFTIEADCRVEGRKAVVFSRIIRQPSGSEISVWQEEVF